LKDSDPTSWRGFEVRFIQLSGNVEDDGLEALKLSLKDPLLDSAINGGAQTVRSISCLVVFTKINFIHNGRLNLSAGFSDAPRTYILSPLICNLEWITLASD
jgi:hypothetical protein